MFILGRAEGLCFSSRTAKHSSLNRESHITKSCLSFSFALDPGTAVNTLQSATCNRAIVTASTATLSATVCCRKGPGRDGVTRYSKIRYKQ